MPELVQASYGHPNLVQLLGYHLMDIINDRRDDGSQLVGLNDMRLAKEWRWMHFRAGR